jgi:hypothetical protein
MTAFGTGDPDGRLAKVAHTETFTAFLTDKGWVLIARMVHGGRAA